MTETFVHIVEDVVQLISKKFETEIEGRFMSCCMFEDAKTEYASEYMSRSIY